MNNNTDLRLIISDDELSIILDVHRSVILSISKYFLGLLTHGKEATSNTITINVPNAIVVRDIILEKYHVPRKDSYPEWKYIIELIKCYDFLEMDFDMNRLYQIKIPSEGFEDLMSIVPLIEDDNRFFRFLKKSIPKDYDKSRLSEELLERLNQVDNYLVAICHKNGIINVFNMSSFKLLYSIKNISNDDIRNILFTSDNKYLICNYGNNIYIFDASNGNQIHKFIGHKGIVNSLSLSPNNKYLASASCDHTVKVWDLQLMKMIRSFDDNKLNHTRGSSNVSISNNKIAISAGIDHVVKIYDIETGKIDLSFNEISNSRTCVKFVNSDNILSIGCQDITLRNLIDCRVMKTYKTKNHSFFGSKTNMAITSDNKTLLFGELNNNIEMWDIETEELISSFQIHRENIIIEHLYLSPDDNYLITSSGHHVFIWDIENKCILRTLETTASYGCFSNFLFNE